MKVSETGDKYLNVVSAFLLLLTFAFYVASFSSQGWALSNDTSERDLTFGIWTSCFYDDKISDRRCQTSDTYVIDAWSDGWVPGIQAMMTLALIGLVGGMTSLATGFIPALDNHPAPIFISLCSTFSFVAWGWAGLIIFISRWSYDENLMNTYLGWCVILGILAMALAMGAIASLFLRVISIQQKRNIKKKAKKAAAKKDTVESRTQPRVNGMDGAMSPRETAFHRREEPEYENTEVKMSYPLSRTRLPPINRAQTASMFAASSVKT